MRYSGLSEAPEFFHLWGFADVVVVEIFLTAFGVIWNKKDNKECEYQN